jgi:hypothetical protein
MTTERRPRPRTPQGIAATTDLKRIPLPALPHFRRGGTEAGAVPVTPSAPSTAAPAVPSPDALRPPASAALSGPVSPLEMSELLAPDHEGGLAPVIESVAPPRTGATGATILNDLVDEIEKGLEKDLARAPIDVIARGYRRVVACAGGPASTDPARPPAGGNERRTDE